jgi:hypothetical protein
LHGKGKKIPNPLDPKLYHVEGALVGNQDTPKKHEKGEQDNEEEGVGDKVSHPEVQPPGKFLESLGANHRGKSFFLFRGGTRGDPGGLSIPVDY